MGSGRFGTVQHTPPSAHTSAYAHTPWDIHIQYSCMPLHTTPLRCGQIPPPHVRAGTPDRNESLAQREIETLVHRNVYPAQIQPRVVDESHVLTAASGLQI